MASPFVHLVIADLVRPHVDLGEGDFPHFLFGSVAPDADKLGLCTREASHFWSFSEDVSGALKLLHTHPQLAAANLAPPERAFVAGYLCHLVTDEQWNVAIYRPFFGRRSPYGGSQEGAELQWALHTLLEQRLMDQGQNAQYTVQNEGAGESHLGFGIEERQETVERAPIDGLVSLLAGSRDRPLRADVLPFLRLLLFEAWRKNVLGQAALAPGAERARHMHAARLALAAIQVDDEMDRSRPIADAARLEHVLQRLPLLLPKAAAYVPREVLAEFERRAVDASVTLLGDYLAGRPPQPPPGTIPLVSPSPRV